MSAHCVWRGDAARASANETSRAMCLRRRSPPPCRSAGHGNWSDEQVCTAQAGCQTRIRRRFSHWGRRRSTASASSVENMGETGSAWKAPMTLTGTWQPPMERSSSPRRPTPWCSRGMRVPTPSYGRSPSMVRTSLRKAGAWPTLSSTMTGATGSRTRTAGRWRLT